MTAINYEAIRQRNIKGYGEFSHHLKPFANLYTERTHFLYELLQNAEDAIRRREDDVEGYAEFSLFPDRLELRHNGKLFDERNVIGICGIGEGTKSGDYSQIGKFGIGFKSVYSYTFSPRIHSGAEHFEIRRFVEPHKLSASLTPNLCVGETCIVLPFDNNDDEQYPFRKRVLPEKAEEEIASALKNLGLRTLLFLHHIKEIRWILPNGTQGSFQCKTRQAGTMNARYVDVTDGENSETWLIFRRDTEVEDEDDDENKLRTVAVETAFLIENGKVSKADNTELVVFFPTGQATGLGFLVQGFFKTNPSRTDIKNVTESLANKHLIDVAAQLAADSLEILCDLDLLSIESYKALPLRSADFAKPYRLSVFRPFYDAIRSALKNKELLPRDGGGYVSVDQARLVRGKELADVFTSEHLGNLFEQKIFWLDTSITAARMPEFYAYLTGKRKSWPTNEWEQEPLSLGIEIDAKDLAGKLSSEFFLRQEESWLVKFYNYMSNNYAPFNDSAFLRLENGSHVSPGKKGAPNAWLPPANLDGIDQALFPLVKQTIVQQSKILEFLGEKVGLVEPKTVDVVKRGILPKYAKEQIAITTEQREEWHKDFEKILFILGESTDNKTALMPSLKKSHIVIVEENCSNKLDLVMAENAYFHTDDTDLFFDGNNNACFVPVDVAKNIVEIFRELGVLLAPRITKEKRANTLGHICIAAYHGWHRRGLDWFDPTWHIDALEFAVANPTMERSRILWQYILRDRKCIRGVVEKSTRQTFENAEREETISDAGKLIIENAWLPGRDGMFHLPKELLLTDLPDNFEKESSSATELADKLGMKKPEQQQALDMLVEGNARKKKLLEVCLTADESLLEKFEKLIPTERLPVEFKSFQEGVKDLHRPQRKSPSENYIPLSGVKNPGRYQEKLDAEVGLAVEETKTQPCVVRFNLVRAQSSNSEARAFLYEQYEGRCQVTEQTFAKASGNNYFEAVSLVSRLDVEYLNHAGNILCLSAETAAKFCHGSFEWVDDLETKIQGFKTEKDGGTLEHRQLRIHLVGQEATITWTEQHFMRLISLWRHA